MIDGRTYRLSEHLARRHLPSWHIAQIHEVAFDHGSFPRSIDSFSELTQIVDSMQENRFEKFMEEKGGLTPEELDVLIEAFVENIIFQKKYLPDVSPRIPYSTLMAHFLIYDKLKSYNPQFKSVLEIGPGCGYLSFFLKHHSKLENYSQVEACEAYYLLQSIVNSHVFSARFEERALPANNGDGSQAMTLERAVIEEPDYVEIGGDPVCTHYPWWQLGALENAGHKFDIVTANANLKEFRPDALRDYLHIIGGVLADDGIMFSQCLGGDLHTSNEKLRHILFDAELAPLTYIEGGAANFMAAPFKGETVKKSFTVGQGVLVKRGHPLFDTYYHRENYSNLFMANEDRIAGMFFKSTENREMYDRPALRQLIEARLAERLENWAEL